MAGLAGVPAAAFARHHGFHVDVVVPAPEVIVQAAPCDATPTQVWVPAVYQTVTEKVWVPEVTTTQIQRVEIPAQYDYRDVIRVDFFGRPHIHREQVLVCPARIEQRPVTVVITSGHFEVQNHQQLVTEGHWETQVVQSAPAVAVQPSVRLEIPAPF